MHCRIFTAILVGIGLFTLSHCSLADHAASRRILGGDNGHVAIVNDKGDLEWEVPYGGATHDLQMLPNGNILLSTDSTTVVEVTHQKQIVWTHKSHPKDGYNGAIEIHAFQRLKNGLTMIAETGNLRIIEVDKDDKIVHEVPLKVDSESTHSDTRRVRKLDNGDYLVCHEHDGVVREYDLTGKVVWSYALDLNGRPASGGHGPEGHGTAVFNALRLRNGNTLIAGGNNNRVFEVTSVGKVVWSIDQKDLPGITLAWVTSLEVLPNGNLIFGNCHAGPDNPQLIEVTRDKQVVWTFKDFKNFGNALPSAEVLDLKGPVLR